MFAARSVFKKKAKRAIEEIRKVAEHIMKTKDVRVDSNLNKFVWHKGVRNVPRRVRVRLERKINEDEEAANKTYTVVSHVEVDSFKAEKKGEKGLTTVVVANEA